jgi:hypothetical protein
VRQRAGSVHVDWVSEATSSHQLCDQNDHEDPEKQSARIPISRSGRVIEAAYWAVPRVRIHSAPPTSHCEPIPVLASFRGSRCCSPHPPSWSPIEVDTARCEEMFMNLQPSVRRGDARAVEVSVKVLDHKAKINNYRPYGRRPEIAVQTNVSVEPPKSDAELQHEAAMYFDLFRAGVQILVDLGVPLPELGRRSVETTATPAQQLEKKEGTGH